ncbi:MAG: hypothetical protein ACPLW9_00955 [Minisyncoccales bacterium]
MKEMKEEKKKDELALPVLNVNEIKKSVNEIQETAKKIQIWVKEQLGQINLIKAAGREAQELFTQKIKNIQDKIEEYLFHEIPAYRRSAWLGLLEFEFSRQELESKAQIWQLIKGLIAEKKLVECANGEGPLKIGGQTYSVSPESMFGEPENFEVAKMLEALIKRVSEKTKTKIETLRQKGNDRLEALVRGLPGVYVVNVPPEKTEKGWRSGGVLLVQSDGQKLYPLNAAGGIEEVIKEMIQNKIFLKIVSLQWDKPPFIPQVAEELNKKVQLLWHLVKRALKNNNAQEKGN